MGVGGKEGGGWVVATAKVKNQITQMTKVWSGCSQSPSTHNGPVTNVALLGLIDIY